MKKLIIVLFIIFVVVYIAYTDNNTENIAGNNEIIDTPKLESNEIIVTIEPEDNNNEEELKQYLSKEHKDIIEEVFSNNIIKKYDEFERINWYKPKGADGSRLSFAFYIYIGEKDDRVWLRFKTGFHEDDWIFFEKIKAFADDYVFEIPFDSYNDKLEKVNNGIHEFIDISVKEEFINDLLKVANAENSKIKFIGKNYSGVYEINLSQKIKLRQTMDLFNYKNGNYENLVATYVDNENVLYKPFVGYWETTKVTDANDILDEGTTLEYRKLYRCFNDNGKMLEIEIDTIGQHYSEYDYTVLDDKTFERITTNGYRFYNEEYLFNEDKLIMYYKNYSGEGYHFQKISKEKFDKILEETKKD